MSEPRGLNLGKTAPTATATPFTPPIQAMPIAAPVVGQALVPFTLQEVIEYGKPAEMGASSVVQKINASTRAGDIDEVGKALNALLQAGHQYDPGKLRPGGFLGFFKKKKRELESHFKSVDAQVATLAQDVEKQIGHFGGRIGDLEKLSKENEARYHEIGKVMVKAEERIAWMEANPPVVDPTSTFSAQNKANWDQVISYAKKRVDDLRRTQSLCELYGPQIEMMKQNAGLLVMKFGEVKSTTLPQMQTSFSLYIINMESEKGAAFSKQIDDSNNDLIRKNADKLGVATVAVRQQMARSSIDLSTLQHAKDAFIRTMDEVKQIETETLARLAAERPLIEQMSQDLAARLNS